MAREYSGAGDPARSIELLWGLNERSKRGPKPKLTLAQITNAAIEIADAEGLDALSPTLVIRNATAGNPTAPGDRPAGR